MWEGKNFSVYTASNFGIRAAVRRVEMCLLNDKINSEEVFLVHRILFMDPQEQ